LGERKKVEALYGISELGRDHRGGRCFLPARFPLASLNSSGSGAKETRGTDADHVPISGKEARGGGAPRFPQRPSPRGRGAGNEKD